MSSVGKMGFPTKVLQNHSQFDYKLNTGGGEGDCRDFWKYGIYNFILIIIQREINDCDLCE